MHHIGLLLQSSNSSLTAEHVHLKKCCVKFKSPWRHWVPRSSLGARVLIILLVVLSRPARCDDLCPVHQGHGHVRPSNDVFHHSAVGLLHCLGLRRRHHTDAVLPAHTVGFPASSHVPGEKRCFNSAASFHVFLQSGSGL